MTRRWLSAAEYARACGLPNAEMSAGAARAALREARTKLADFERWARDDVPRIRCLQDSQGRARIAEMRGEFNSRVSECEANARRLGVDVA